MGRKTIDFGIDLGTTNSVIACLDRGELVIVRNQVTNSEVTPSAVKMDARGSVTVGQNAYNELEFDPDNAVGEFKRWMGNPQVDGFTFKKAGKRLTAAELSAEVLKNLKGSAATRFAGEHLDAAVITVPANFLIPACEDTTAAAKLAGIDLCPFIQEPVAAAMAYGYQAESLSGNLLVVDLGGGTFDTSLLSACEGKFVVLGHDGDAKLGGKDFDWALVEVIVRRIRQEYGDIPLCRSNDAAKRAMATLKFRAEEAKKMLSALQKVSIEISRLGPPFAEIDTVVELTRADLERATEHLTSRCMSISTRLLEQCGVSSDGLASVLVVGGQTQTPYFRETILARFGKAECKLDPLTVVATGAALYASTQRVPSRLTKAAAHPGSKISLKIAYRAVSSDAEAEIGLAISPALSGTIVTVFRADGGWNSGAIPIPTSGNLFTTVVLRPRLVNSFEVHLEDPRGSRIIADDSSFSITQGLIADMTTSKTLAVALANNVAEVLLRKGSPLPAKGCHRYTTAHDVIAGDPRSVLRTYFLEGDYTRSDRNIAIGSIELHGSDLRRTLGAGAEVEIRYQLDQSKNLSAEAFFPGVNETCVMVRMRSLPELLTAEIELELIKEKDRLADIERAAAESVDPTIGQEILLIEREKRAAAEDPDAQQKAPLQLLELKAAIDEMERLYEWDLLSTELNDFRDPARKLSQASGSEDQAREVEESIRSAEGALSRRDLAVMRTAMEELKNGYWTIECARDEFWKERLAWLKKQTNFVDSLEAERLKEAGADAVVRNDIELLQTIVRNLYALSPLRQQGKLDERFKRAGLVSTF
ncbi:MAG: Hsp70 family protein [Acidobacteriaceae bacterium]